MPPTSAVTSDRTKACMPVALSAADLSARLSMQLMMADPTTTPSARPDTSATWMIHHIGAMIDAGYITVMMMESEYLFRGGYSETDGEGNLCVLSNARDKVFQIARECTLRYFIRQGNCSGVFMLI